MTALYRLHLYGKPEEFRNYKFVVHNDFRMDKIEPLGIDQDDLIVSYKTKVPDFK